MGIITDEMTLAKCPRGLRFGSHGQTGPLRSDPASSVQEQDFIWKPTIPQTLTAEAKITLCAGL